MNDQPDRKEPSVLGAILRAIWRCEKSSWRWAVALGLTNEVVIAVVGGFFGYASYGYPGMVGGAVPGAILGWIVATWVFHVPLSTASYFN